MDTSAQNRVEQRIKDGYELGFSDILNKTFETWKGIWLLAGAAFLVVYIVQFVINNLIQLIFGVSTAFSPELIEEMQYNPEAYLDVFATPMFILSVILQIVVGILMIPAYCGFFRMAYRYDHEGRHDFGDFFYYYKSSYFLRIILTTLLWYVLIYVGFIFLIIPGIYLSVAYAITLPFIVFANATSWEALEASRKLITKNWFTIFALIIVAGILSILGVFACGIGVFFTYSIFFIMLYTLYKEIIGFDEFNEIDQIGSTPTEV